MTTALIFVDVHTIHGRKCKITLHDELAEKCHDSSVAFDQISSNHVGLADQLWKRRKEVGMYFE